MSGSVKGARTLGCEGFGREGEGELYARRKTIFVTLKHEGGVLVI